MPSTSACYTTAKQKNVVIRKEDILYEYLKYAALVFKYLGMGAGAYLTWIALHAKTGSDHPEDHARVLTPAGKKYRIILIVSAAVTITAAICENIADSHIKQAAEARGNDKFTKALQAQNESFRKDLEAQSQKYIVDLSNQLETKVTPRIDDQTKKLNVAATHLGRQISRTEDALALSNVELEILKVWLTTTLSLKPIFPTADMTAYGDVASYMKKTCGYDPLARVGDRIRQEIVVSDGTQPASEAPSVNEDACREASAAEARWDTQTQLLGLFDPTNHLSQEITLKFNGFRVEGWTDQCAIAGKSYRCLAFQILSERLEQPVTERMEIVRDSGSLPIRTRTPGSFEFLGDTRGGVNIELVIPPESWKKAFQGHGIYGRDTDLKSLEVWACDPATAEENTEKEQHLKQFFDRKFFDVRLDARESQTHKPYRKIATLRNSDRKKYSPDFVPDRQKTELCQGYAYKPRVD